MSGLTVPSPVCPVSQSAPVGRFAPSPTGPLHAGSILAALASNLSARVAGGRWLVRMEDLDRPRCPPGMADVVLRQLDALGFAWDGEVMYQSQRDEAYAAALAQLDAAGLSYPCACTRRELADSASSGRLARDGGLLYPGTCRAGLAPGRAARALRFCAPAGAQHWVDRIQGPQCEDVAHDAGDFVLRRADGLFAYQLAVVVDDAAQGVTEVVRGADLLDSTGRQRVLQQALGYAEPHWAHVPVLTNVAGEKLSKQTLAQAVDTEQPAVTLCRALDQLGQLPPARLGRASAREVWDWALAHWDEARVPRVRGLVAESA